MLVAGRDEPAPIQPAEGNRAPTSPDPPIRLPDCSCGVDDHSTAEGREGPAGDRRPRRASRPGPHRVVATSPDPPACDGLVVLHPTEGELDAEREYMAQSGALLKAQSQLAAQHERLMAELDKSAPSPELRALLHRPRRPGRLRAAARSLADLRWTQAVGRVEVWFRRQHAALLDGHGFQAYVPFLERKCTELRLECRQITRELDAARRISVQPSGRGFVNEFELQLRRYFVRSLARRGPPDADADDEDPALIRGLRRLLSWLALAKEADRVGK